jgi:hypothetical protein
MPLTSLGLAEVPQNGFQNFSHIAVGKGTTDFSESQTTLVSEVDRIAVGAVSYNAGIATIEALMANSEGNPGGTDEISEVGLFNAASGGSMWQRVVLTTTIPKTSAKAMLLSIQEALANA